MAELNEFALHAPVPPGGIVLSDADHELADRGCRGRPPGTPPARIIPNLVGLYAAERAREEECPTEIRAAMSRLLGWYVHSAAAAGQVITPNTHPILDGRPPDGIRPWTPLDPRQAIGWLTSELPNLRAVAREAAMRKDNQPASMIAAALRTFHERSTPCQIDHDLGHPLASSQAIEESPRGRQTECRLPRPCASIPTSISFGRWPPPWLRRDRMIADLHARCGPQDV